MKWSKRGMIFDPTQHALPHDCHGFAQSPQTLVMSDRVRVYFSTRHSDAIGKYVSHVAFVDFDRSMDNALGISAHTVIGLGGLGCFDEHGIFPISVLRDGDRVLAYTTGWNRKVSVSVDTAIGLAISHNEGWTFEKVGSGPIVAASLHEPFLIADAFVRRYEGLYHMWYIYGTKWNVFVESAPPDRVYKIAHATSQDGMSWRRDGRHIVSDRLGSDECQALPTVLYHDGNYHMYFCYRQASGFRTETNRAYRIGYARSTDLITWHRDDAVAGIDVSDSGWDSEMQCYPHIFDVDGTVHMLYNGNDFGRYGFGLATLEN